MSAEGAGPAAPSPAELERAERLALADHWAAAPSGLAEEHGIRVAEVGGALCRAVGTADGVRSLNQAVGLGIERPATDDDLDEIERFFADAGVRHFVALAPAARPPELRDRLAERGYGESYAWMKFALGSIPETGVETDLRVEATGPERAEEFAQVLVTGDEMPHAFTEWMAVLPGREGWRCWLALDGDDAVAAAALYLAGEIGWLGFAATLPDHRGRGAQSALIAARIDAAFDAGCTALTTETGANVEGRPAVSYRNLVRAGFQPAYLRPNLEAPRP